MTYTASVTYNGRVEVLENLEYRNIRECKNELRNNGYKVRFVCKPEDFDEACSRYHKKVSDKAFINKAKNKFYKEEAAKYNTSIKTMKSAYKTYLEKDENGEYKYDAMDLKDWVEYYDKHKEWR